MPIQRHAYNTGEKHENPINFIPLIWFDFV